jgi:hypothetical protein
MNVRGKTAIKENKTKLTASNLIRWAGFAALLAGIIFAGIQPIHPPDFLPSVTTTAWATIMPVKLLMCLLFLLGFTGLYARQVEETGWIGLVSFLMLSLSWTIQTAFIFVETFILPVLAVPAPEFVESILGIFNGFPGDMNIGALPAVYGLTGLLYMLGGLLFGIATFRAGILPRWAAGLLAVAAAVTPAAALLPHAIQRFAGIPVGLAVAWMGFALVFERREKSSEAVPGKVSPQFSQTEAKEIR